MTEPTDIDALIAAALTWNPAECTASPVGAAHTIERLADALESTAAELRQERGRADEAENADAAHQEQWTTSYYRALDERDQAQERADEAENARDGWMAQQAKTAADLARAREVIEKELARHTEKHGETPRYAPDDYQAEREPTHWEPYVICNACGTDYPCRTRQTLSTYDKKVIS